MHCQRQLVRAAAASAARRPTTTAAVRSPLICTTIRHKTSDTNPPTTRASNPASSPDLQGVVEAYHDTLVPPLPASAMAGFSFTPKNAFAHAFSTLSEPEPQSTTGGGTKAPVSGKKGPPKVCGTADEAVAHIKSGDRVYVHGVAAVPSTLLKALEKRHSELKNVEFTHLHLETANPCSKQEYRESFFTNNFFIGKNQRKPVAQGISSYVPTFLSEIPALMLAAALPAAQTAKIIIAQINPNMPRTQGYSFIHWDELDYVVHVNDPLPMHKGGAIGEVEQKIGKIIAGLVSDGATLQMGIGGVPDAVLAQLGNHKDLGIHTEMFAEGAIDLIEKGVITNLRKTFLPGKTVTSFVMGTQRLYDFVHDNPAVSFMDASVTNNPSIIGSNPRVTAINSALEVDITGQVCADSIGPQMVSGVGGQVDFERGAALSHGGLPIICLPSTTKHGESRIVSMLKQGAGVITSRYHAHYIVTEYGYAYLFGKNLHQRAKAMINIAHPDHRAELEKLAFERYNIKGW
ncbi:hypothetical protein HK102_002134 [Quaeritorhiza haematococci]|nr:hypothetical protein HK102_002134 [Quaeritorhiza haematococci]